MSFVSNLAHSLVIEWKMSNILTKNKMNGIKKIDSNCENVLPHTKMAGRDKNDRTNSRTFCQQNRIAFSRESARASSHRRHRAGWREASWVGLVVRCEMALWIFESYVSLEIFVGTIHRIPNLTNLAVTSWDFSCFLSPGLWYVIPTLLRMKTWTSGKSWRLISYLSASIKFVSQWCIAVHMRISLETH